MGLDTNQSISTVKREQLEVLSIAEGFFQSTVLSALLRLKVFDHIGEETNDTSSCRTLLDLGCGPGTYAFHLVMRNPNPIRLCITTDGSKHSVGETRQRMDEAGFKNLEYCPMTLLNTNSCLRVYKI